MYTEDYVSFEVAKLLKEKGFNEPCFSHFTDTGSVWRCEDAECFNSEKDLEVYSRPTLWQAAKWLRGKGWHVQVMLNGVRTAYFVRVYEIVGNGKVIEVPGLYGDYESALAAGIEAAVKLI